MRARGACAPAKTRERARASASEGALANEGALTSQHTPGCLGACERAGTKHSFLVAVLKTGGSCNMLVPFLTMARACVHIECVHNMCTFVHMLSPFRVNVSSRLFELAFTCGHTYFILRSQHMGSLGKRSHVFTIFAQACVTWGRLRMRAHSDTSVRNRMFRLGPAAAATATPSSSEQQQQQ